MPNVEIAAICDIDESMLNAASGRDREGSGKKRPAAFTDLRKLLEDKSHRRHLDRHAEPPPHAADHLGAARRARTCTSRSRARTTCSRRGRSWRRRRSTTAWCSTAPTAARRQRCARRSSRCATALIGDVYMARGLCLQVARHHRPQAGRAGARRRPLRSVARSGAGARVHAEPLPLQLALVLGLRQRRPRQPGHPPGGHRALGLGVKYPTKVSAIGGHFMFDDDQETPNTMTATFEFDDGGKKKMMVFEVRHWMTQPRGGSWRGQTADKRRRGNLVYGSKGYLGTAGRDTRSFLARSSSPGRRLAAIAGGQLGQLHPGGAQPRNSQT